MQELLKVYYDTELKYYRVFNTDGTEIKPIGKVRVSDEWAEPFNHGLEIGRFRASIVLQAPVEVVNEMPRKNTNAQS